MSASPTPPHLHRPSAAAVSAQESEAPTAEFVEPDELGDIGMRLVRASLQSIGSQLEKISQDQAQQRMDMLALSEVVAKRDARILGKLEQMITSMEGRNAHVDQMAAAFFTMRDGFADLKSSIGTLRSAVDEIKNRLDRVTDNSAP